MKEIFLNEFIPPFIFFVIFAIFFTVLELITILLLNQLERKNWEWVIDVLIRSQVHYRQIIKYSVITALGVLFILLIIYTPLVPILTTASNGFKLFALLLALVMLLMYLINIRKSSKIDIEKKMYGIVFFAISLILYFAVVITAQKSYESYSQYVNRNFIEPAVKKVETVLEDREKVQLLKNARQQYLSNRCEPVDYTKDEKVILMKNILLLAKEPDLGFGDKTVDLENPEDVLKGMACSDGEKTLLLVENGNWYLVNEEYIQYLK